MKRNDPLTASRYRVELGDVGEGFFLECSGLKNTTEVVEHWEGGENRFVHKFQGNTKFSNITLKHGIGKFSKELRHWRDAVVNGKKRMFFDGAVVLLDDEGEETARWTFREGFFTRWEGGEIKGGGNSLAVETLEIACKMWSLKIDDKKFKPPVPPTPPEPDHVTAMFSPMKEKIFEGEEVKFTDKSVSAKPIQSWDWKCESNNAWASSDTNPTAKFDKVGVYRIKLKVTSGSGKSDTATGMVTVRKDRIRAAFDPDPDTIMPGEEIAFTDKSESVHKITEWAWSCPDNEGWTSSDQNSSARFEKPGEYEVELSVTSSSGKNDSTRRTVTVKAEEVKAAFEFNSDIIKDGKLDKFKFIPFKYNSSQLTSKAVSLLKEAVEVFKDNKGLRVDLKGWASKEGSASYNLKLSDRRARSVQSHMKKKGVGPDQIVTAKGLGETEQFAAGNSENALSKNRRVEWIVRSDSVVQLRLRVGDKVKFTDKSTANTSVAKWKWSCEAAQWQPSDTDQNPVATFGEAGSHAVLLEITGSYDEIDSVAHTVEVAPKNE